MNEILLKITAPIAMEMSQFNDIFHDSLSHTDGLLNEVLLHIMQRGGKRMRPMLTLLIAKSFAPKKFTPELLYKALHAACSLELLHTASLVHDDVVDESDQRRGQKSVNASYTNRIAILVGDYILSTSLNETALTNDPEMTKVLSQLGKTLSEGEVIQIQNISDLNFSIERYYDIIQRKTSSLFEACCHLGSLAVGANAEQVKDACMFGQNIGTIFQIRDDIFDYYDNAEIGKPTGADMREGKLTLPVLYVLNYIGNDRVKELALKVKKLKANDKEITELIELTKELGGIEYAQKMMNEYYDKAMQFFDTNEVNNDLKEALIAYLDHVIGRIN